MDYYKKYQKYKLKYLNLLSSIQSGAGGTNLLNQSGGNNYTEKDFDLLDKYKYKYEYVIQQNLDTSETRALFELINEKGFLKDKDEKNELGESLLLEDNITTGNIHITKAVLIGNNVHDVNSILNSIKNKMDFDPFTREPFKLTNLLDVINKLNNENDKQFIINYIISTLNSEKKIILESLNQEQIKILFSKNKIDILETFGINTFRNLLNNYKHLLSYTNSDNVILTAINENYKAFILVPESKQTYKICLEVVKINSEALEFVPEYKKNYEICLKAVEKNGNALQYVPKKINIFDICETAVKQNSYALQYVLTDNMTEEEYYTICEIAVQKKSLILKYVLHKKMTPDKYLHICKLALNKVNLKVILTNEEIYDLYLLAVINCGLALQYVNKNIMSKYEYYKICKSAFENNALALQYVDINNMSKDEYYDICHFAVIENPLALQYVDKKIISEKYYAICKLALQYLDSDRYKITTEEIYEICKLAVEYDSNLFKFVPKQILLDSQLLLLLKIVNPDRKYKVNIN